MSSPERASSTLRVSSLSLFIALSPLLGISRCASGPGSAAGIEGAAGDAILTTSPGGALEIGGGAHPLQEAGFGPIDLGDGEVPALFAVFDDEEIVVIVPIDGEELTGEFILQLGDDRLSCLDAEVQDFAAEDSLVATGIFRGKDGREEAFRLSLSIGAGTSTFELEDDLAILRGDLGSGTYEQMEYLIEHHPEVTTILFQEVPGSVNDEINVETGRLIRRAGYTTRVPADGMIASGGVDLFVAGVRRCIEDGARLGVHSWGDPSGDVVANDLPRDHPAHQSQIAYFSEMLPHGKEFYFYTLQAAPFGGIHFMSVDEIADWGLATNKP